MATAIGERRGHRGVGVHGARGGNLRGAEQAARRAVETDLDRAAAGRARDLGGGKDPTGDTSGISVGVHRRVIK